MAPLIALFLLVYWWLPTVMGSLPLPVRRFCTYTVRISKRVVRGFFLFTLLRPSQRVAQRHGWFAGILTFNILLSLLLVMLSFLFALPGGVRIVFVPLLFVIGGGILLKTFPQRFHSRALYPLPRRRRRRRFSHRR